MGLVTLFSSHDGYLPDFAQTLANRAEPDVTFEYTLTVKHCIDTITGFLRRVDIEPRPAIADILTQFESTVGQFPLGCQICLELLKIGCARYREFTTLKATGFCIRSRES
ncbi:hypothetical protein JFM25_002714 [Salmonella enterica]|uniref:Uncharacterized protein n=6 Tax=Salmonella enterica TaxID=28901 RepID=A0A6C7D4C1_SALER|nr:hypothetical protein DOE60_16895 [Salmonella enterica subsp. salamae serovar 56:z10:e,n,x]AXC85139.1 hypothetical protein DOE57_07360 [Salmonella enterica subsp. salamae serovar 56:b:[1,5]]EAA6223156.1 hypothetical protein [Salmonella enterica subsp. salamae]EAM3923138.1 hypothetical protein [Salmonella enterica]EBE1546641.1 hypothetical protein [Salmonella enterica subsp. enterica]EBW7587462.1 hypothetical protein [Salmonella enterica subsp. salamae serovar Sofia]EDX4960273.1 hypothetical